MTKLDRKSWTESEINPNNSYSIQDNGMTPTGYMVALKNTSNGCNNIIRLGYNSRRKHMAKIYVILFIIYCL